MTDRITMEGRPGPVSRVRPPRGNGHRKSLGQAMVEFAFVSGILIFLLIGVIEAGILTFVIGSARYAAGVGAREGAELGNSDTADAQIVAKIRQSPMGTTSLAHVTSIDVFKVDYTPSNGDLTPDPFLVNHYDLTGAPIGSVAWPPSARNVSSNSDFIGVRVNFRYDWKSGILISATPLNLNSMYWTRLEPQVY